MKFNTKTSKETLKKGKIPTDIYRKHQKKKEKKKKKKERAEQLEIIISKKNPYVVKEKLDTLKKKEKQGKLLPVEKNKLKQYERLWNIIKEKVKDKTYFYNNNGVIYNMNDENDDNKDNSESDEFDEQDENDESDESDKSGDSNKDRSISEGNVPSAEAELNAHPLFPNNSVDENIIKSIDDNEGDDFFLECLPSLPIGLPSEFIRENADTLERDYCFHLKGNSTNGYFNYTPYTAFNAASNSNSCTYNNRQYSGTPDLASYYYNYYNCYQQPFYENSGNNNNGENYLNMQGKKEKVPLNNEPNVNIRNFNKTSNNNNVRNSDLSNSNYNSNNNNSNNVNKIRTDGICEGPTLCLNDEFNKAKLDEEGNQLLNDVRNGNTNNAHDNCNNENNYVNNALKKNIKNSNIHNTVNVFNYANMYYHNFMPMHYNNTLNNNSFRSNNCSAHAYNNNAVNYAMSNGHTNNSYVHSNYINSSHMNRVYMNNNLMKNIYDVDPKNHTRKGKRYNNTNTHNGENSLTKKSCTEKDSYHNISSNHHARTSKANNSAMHVNKNSTSTNKINTNRNNVMDKSNEPNNAQYFVPINLRLKNKLNDLCETTINAVDKGKKDEDKNINIDLEYNKFIKEVNLN
ncbi:WW domain-binding protein 11, putative [Plasmodium malariae]|uniref:WW domain-binding protein 11, putative n=1 Tax=Plasmodium malariae TaxID=5858 RepID=A0A1C3KEZ5_PLAMA|nr:WW domain-binding protein 11, putative [Plasmodium malariae]